MNNRNLDIKTNLLSHSEAKIKLLGDYLYKYLSIIGNDPYTKHIRLYDLFCGPGLYENEGEGSPLVILRKINEFYKASYNEMPKIDCFFNDYSTDKIAILKSIVENDFNYNNPYGSTSFHSKDYSEIIKSLPLNLSTGTDHKAFIFIDPYGYREIKASHIKSLLQNGKSEVLLWLPTQHMYRFSGYGTPESLHAFIEELTQFQDWKPSDSVWKFIKQLKNGFRNFLGNKYFVSPFTIQKDAQTVYCLFFFTSHIKGYEKMLETKWAIDKEFGKGWEYRGNSPGLFYEQRTNELEENLRIYLQESKRSNGEIYEFTLRQEYLPKHTNEILKNWQENKMITVKLRSGNEARKKSFYVNYENFNKHYNKVSIQLK